ncbi:thylakoid membrane protein [Volvox carteri f. nagariensis]|uniref:Thylakoid membrane protein n=1 Tax=Volvox carteri f. nagariensis TaxID=3068 RepID=Q9SBM7_VOLCA|nr:thylakoid membrane protein [Volvox carteri f. nagariensis]AAD55571.1 unknown [Volvox carteri f. nagariensis]EFJ40084.1 thylakoid membrane protein [Volvox carteri f. nagariensis]|eukprot:XP_002958833.1 thylakoid membrane protein [Volvox carteri f. nagariensis]
MLVAKRNAVQVRASGSAALSMSRSAARSVAVSSRIALSSWDDCRQTASSLAQSAPKLQNTSNAPRRKPVTMMGNKATTGPFAPLVVVVRGAIGEKEFNQFRGKAISLHSQVIKDFCKLLGVDNKQVQGVIRLAKKNGEKLGFLA